MNKVLLGMVMVTALACGSDAAELFGVPDAGAQPDAGERFDYTCPEVGWLKTDIDQRPLGEIGIFWSQPAAGWLGLEGQVVDVQNVANFSINGKVAINCEPGLPFTIEVR